MNHQPDRLTQGLDALRETPAPRQQADHRAAFLAAAQRLRETGVSATPAVRHRLWGAQPPHEPNAQGEADMKPTRIRRQIAVAAAVIVVMLVGALAFSPDFRALAQELIDLITPGEDDTTVINVYPAGPEQTPPPVESPKSLNGLTLEEAAEVAPFDIRVPAYMPETYTFRDATYAPFVQSLMLNYTCGSWSVGIIQDLLREGAIYGPMEVGASANIVEVDLGNGITGQYVRGEWQIDSGDQSLQGTPGSIPLTATWSEETEFQRLVWTEGNLRLSVTTASGLVGEYATTCALDQDDYVAIARSLVADTTQAANLDAATAEPLARVGSPVLFPLAASDTTSLVLDVSESESYVAAESWAEAVSVAGFDIPEPNIPENFELASVGYHTDIRTLSAAYALGGASEHSMSLFVAVWPLDAFEQADPLMRDVGVSATVEQVQIGGIMGEHVNGMWEAQYDMSNAEPGQTFSPTPGVPLEMRWMSEVAYRRIRWQHGGMVYELAGGGRPGEYLSVDDLLPIAESMIAD